MFESDSINTLVDDELLTRTLKNRYEDINIKVSNGLVEVYKKTNIKKVIPIIYRIKYKNTNTTILYYKVDDIKERRYYIPKIKKCFSLPEIKSYLNKIYE